MQEGERGHTKCQGFGALLKQTLSSSGCACSGQEV